MTLMRLNKASIVRKYVVAHAQIAAFKSDRKPAENPRKIPENPHKLPENPRKIPENPRKLDTTSLHRIPESHRILNKDFPKNETDFKQNVFHFMKSPLENKVDQKAIPLAVILGWASSTDENILKYANLYQELGYQTLRISFTFGAGSALKTKEHDKFALGLLKLIQSDQQINRNSVVIHTLSNAGTFIYRHLLEYAQDVDEYAFMKSSIKCLIHDSGPGLNKDYLDTIENVAKSVKNVRNTSTSTIGSVAEVITGMVKYMRDDYVNATMERLAKDPNKIPTLFLYSKADRLISHEEVTRFIEKRKEFLPDVNIESVLFDDSEHVSHFVQHRDEYLAKLKEHLKRSNLPIYEVKPEVLN